MSTNAQNCSFFYRKEGRERVVEQWLKSKKNHVTMIHHPNITLTNFKRRRDRESRRTLTPTKEKGERGEKTKEEEIERKKEERTINARGKKRGKKQARKEEAGRVASYSLQPPEVPTAGFWL